jgi:CubicO group peptidase (beta-lactamase class C family)
MWTNCPRRPRRRSSWVAALAVLVLGVPSPAAAQADDRDPTFIALQTMMRGWVRQYDVPAASVAVIKDQGRMRRLRYGGMDPESPARIASLSKAITGVCIARLVDDGRLSFTATVGAVLAPAFRKYGEPVDPRFKEITVEQLLAHRAGLARESKPPARSGDMAASFAKALATSLEEAPNRRMSYSNVGYLTLGMIVEAVAGDDYERHCRRSALAPLGATGVIDPELRHRAPNGGWRVSAVDYAKFVQVWDKGNGVLGPISRHWLGSQRGALTYGLGTRMHRTPHGIRFFHSGRVASRERGGAFTYKFENGWTVVVIFEGNIRREGRAALPKGLRVVFLSE